MRTLVLRKYRTKVLATNLIRGEFTGHHIISYWEVNQLMSRILLLIDRHQQQDLPIAHLNTEHEAIVPDGAGEPNSKFCLTQIAFDLCILDEKNYDRIKLLIEPLKTAADPIFLPFLLLEKSQTPALAEKLFSPTGQQLDRRIDDLIATPVSAAGLHLRIENLLARRRLSLELHRLQELNKERTFTENLLIESVETANENLQREIAKRAEVEAALRENSYLNLLMNAMPDLVCFKDGEGRWQEANQAILECQFRAVMDGEINLELLPEKLMPRQDMWGVYTEGWDWSW